MVKAPFSGTETSQVSSYSLKSRDQDLSNHLTVVVRRHVASAARCGREEGWHQICCAISATSLAGREGGHQVMSGRPCGPTQKQWLVEMIDGGR